MYLCLDIHLKDKVKTLYKGGKTCRGEVKENAKMVGDCLAALDKEIQYKKRESKQEVGRIRRQMEEVEKVRQEVERLSVASA